jgi:hypothetical protein
VTPYTAFILIGIFAVTGVYGVAVYEGERNKRNIFREIFKSSLTKGDGDDGDRKGMPAGGEPVAEREQKHDSRMALWLSDRPTRRPRFGGQAYKRRKGAK